MNVSIDVPDKEIYIDESHILPIILKSYAYRFVKIRDSELIGDVRYSFGWSVNVGCMVFEYEIRHGPRGSNDVLSVICRHIPRSTESLDIFLLRILKEIVENYR